MCVKPAFFSLQSSFSYTIGGIATTRTMRMRSTGPVLVASAGSSSSSSSGSSGELDHDGRGSVQRRRRRRREGDLTGLTGLDDGAERADDRLEDGEEARAKLGLFV